jgi:hypothetical protein
MAFVPEHQGKYQVFVCFLALGIGPQHGPDCDEGGELR